MSDKFAFTLNVARFSSSCSSRLPLPQQYTANTDLPGFCPLHNPGWNQHNR